MFSIVRNWISPDLGIDLGSTTTRVYVQGRGVVLEIPSALAIDVGSDQIIEVGEAAECYLGHRAGKVMVVGPLKNGRIVDVDIAAAFLRHCIEKVFPRQLWRKSTRPRAVITVRRGVTEVEKCVMELAAYKAGMGDTFLLEAPMAAAIGAGLPVTDNFGGMVVEIGGHACRTAVISEAGIIADRTCPGGDVFDLCVLSHMGSAYNMAIDARTAEMVKTTIGSVSPVGQKTDMEVFGEDLESGLPRKVTVTSEEIRRVLGGQALFIVKNVLEVIRESAPRFSKELREQGIVLTGGGSLLRGLDELLAKETGLKVVRAEVPASSAIEGVGMVLKELVKGNLVGNCHCSYE